MAISRGSLVQLTEREKAIIERAANERDLGGKGFSAALRQIINEWDEMTRARVEDPRPTAKGKR